MKMAFYQLESTQIPLKTYRASPQVKGRLFGIFGILDVGKSIDIEEYSFVFRPVHWNDDRLPHIKIDDEYERDSRSGEPIHFVYQVR
ncbi:MAG: hypothetical protein CMG78_10720, partial [Marinobacter sp.]|nr:hypothetical protein [Marinobacter sp.]